MNLKAYIKPLIDYWWLIFLAAIVAMGATFVVVRSQPDIYQTRTTLVVGNMMYEANPSSNDMYLGQQLANYYAKIGSQGELKKSTQDALGMTWLPQYSIIPVPNSQLIEIVVNDTDPQRAQVVANELAQQLIFASPTAYQQQDSNQQSFIEEQVGYLEEKISETLSEIEVAEKDLSETNSAQQIAEIQAEIVALQAKLAQMQSNYAALLANTERGAINVLSVIEPAELPTSTVGPSKIMMVLIAGVVAAVIAVLAAYTLEFLDDSIKTPGQITKLLSLPVLGSIPKVKRTAEKNNLLQLLEKRVPAAEETNPFWETGYEADTDIPSVSMQPIAEEFRLLRMGLSHTCNNHLPESILITSPSPREGKSLLAANLALAIAQSGQKVVLINANFDHEADRKGLSDLLLGNWDIEDVKKPLQENLDYIPAGMTPPNIVEILSAPHVKDLLRRLREISDVVIIDSSSLSTADSFELSTQVEGVLLVIRYGHTRKGTAQSQCEKLDQVGANVIGAVLNCVQV
jgi:capsular exopolysaccharide synthesis family protein